MKRFFKTFLLWLLMAVLPLHALAAGMGMSCASVHGKAAQHGMGPAASHHGGAHAAATDAHAGHAMAGHEVHQAEADDQQTPGSCSACSALCIGAAAPPPAFLSLPSFDGSNAVLVTPAALAAGFIPDGPQRPPRRQSA